MQDAGWARGEEQVGVKGAGVARRNYGNLLFGGVTTL